MVLSHQSNAPARHHGTPSLDPTTPPRTEDRLQGNPKLLRRSMQRACVRKLPTHLAQ